MKTSSADSRWNWTGRRMLAAVTLGVALMVGCSAADRAPTAPPAPSVAAPLLGETVDLLGGTVTTLGKTLGLVSSCTPLPSATVSKVIGPNGGTISFGPHTIYFPQGALQESTLITATAPSSSTPLAQFQPHGLTFPGGSKSPVLSMSYANCSTSLLERKIVYVDNALTILEILKSAELKNEQVAVAQLRHFSSYAVAE